MNPSTINRVRSLALKTDSSDARLGRLNLVLGPVGSGKSTIADAVQFVALGYVPRIGKAAAFTARLMRGPRAEAAITFVHDGSTIDALRNLTNDGKSLAGDASGSWLPKGLTATQIGESIRLLFGATEAEAEQNLDIARLLGAQAGDLAATVERLLDAAGMDAAEIRTVVETQFRGRVQTLRPNTDGILGELPKPVADSLEAVLRALLDRASRSLLDARAWAAQQRIEQDGTLRQKRAAAADAEQRIAQLRTPSEAAENLRGRLENNRARRTTLKEQLRLYRDGADRRARMQRDFETARSGAELAAENLAAKTADAAALPDLRAKLAALVAPAAPASPRLAAVDPEEVRRATEALCRELEAVTDPAEPTPEAAVEPSAVELERAAALIAEADGLTARVDAIVKTQVPGTDVAEGALSDAEKALRSAEALPWREVEKIADEIQAASGCDSEGPHPIVDRLRALARQHGGNLEELRFGVTACRNSLEIARQRSADARAKRDAEDAEESRLRTEAGQKAAEAIKVRRDAQDAAKAANSAAQQRFTAAHAQWRKDIADVRQRRDDLRARIEQAAADVRKVVDDANRAANDQHAAAMSEFQRAHADVDAQRRALQTQIDDLDGALRRAERIERDQRAAREAARAALEADAEAMTVDVPAAETEIAALDRYIATLEQDLKAFAEVEAEHSTLARIVRESDAAEALRDLYTAAEWAVNKAREQDIRRRAGALEEPMRRFLAPVGIAAEPTVRAEKGKVQLGLRYGERFVDASALSGGQSALFRAALGYAVLAARKPILRVLHIELAEACDGDLEDRILRACEAVQDDVQVIVTTCVPITEPEASRGWNVVRLDREVAHAAA